MNAHPIKLVQKFNFSLHNLCYIKPMIFITLLNYSVYWHEILII